LALKQGDYNRRIPPLRPAPATAGKGHIDGYDYGNSVHTLFDVSEHGMPANTMGFATIRVDHLAGANDSATIGINTAFQGMDSSIPRFSVPVSVNQISHHSFQKYGSPLLGGNQGVITVYSDSNPTYFNSQWFFGDAIQLYSDGTGAGNRFLDSDLFIGGANTTSLYEDSTWDAYTGGGLLADSTSSAPDSDFRNVETVDSEFYAPYGIATIPNVDIRGQIFGKSARTGGDILHTNNLIIEYARDLDSNSAFATKDFIEVGALSGGAGGGADQAELDSANQLIELLRSNLDSANVDALDSANQLITLLRSNLDSAGDPEAWS